MKQRTITQLELELPYMIFRGNTHRPERCNGYKLPVGTLVFSDLRQWQTACKGKPDMNVFRFMTKSGHLLYAIVP